MTVYDDPNGVLREKRARDNRLLIDPRWNERENARLRSERRVCRLDGCDLEIPPNRSRYCGDKHGNTDRQRQRRARADGRSDREIALGQSLIITGATRYRRRSRRPILPSNDRFLVYDRISTSYMRSIEVADSLCGYPIAAEMAPLRVRQVGKALSSDERKALEGQVCYMCQRFAGDCGLLHGNAHENFWGPPRSRLVGRIVAIDELPPPIERAA